MMTDLNEHDKAFIQDIHLAAKTLRKVAAYYHEGDDSVSIDSVEYSASALEIFADEYERKELLHEYHITELADIIQHYAGSGAWEYAKAKQTARAIFNEGWRKNDGHNA